VGNILNYYRGRRNAERTIEDIQDREETPRFSLELDVIGILSTREIEITISVEDSDDVDIATKATALES
jgi:hypothetical protein